jgi:hypothetical protein
MLVKLQQVLGRLQESYYRYSYIWGAGTTGQRLYNNLLKENVKITGFIDSNSDNSKICDLPVFIPDVLIDKNPKEVFIIIAVQGESFFEQICDFLTAYGYTDGDNFMDFIFFRHSPDWNMQQIIHDAIVPFSSARDKYVKQYCDSYQDMTEAFENHRDGRMILSQLPNPENIETTYGDLWIPNLTVAITTYCSLNCLSCSLCIPYNRHPRHITDIESIANDIEKLASIYKIPLLAVQGGEIMLYPCLVELLKRLRNIANVEFLKLVVNGDVIPSKDVFRELASIDRLYISISNYKTSTNKTKTMEKLLNVYGIPYVCRNQDELWGRHGDFSFRRYNYETRKKLFLTCTNCNLIFEGRLYRCSRILGAREVHAIPDNSNDYMDLHNQSIENLPKALTNFLFKTDQLPGCDYCNGIAYNLGRSVKGFQLKRKLPYKMFEYSTNREMVCNV